MFVSTLMAKRKKCRKIYDTFVFGKHGKRKLSLFRFIRFYSLYPRVHVVGTQMDSFEFVVLRLKATKFHLDFLMAVSSVF